MNAVPDIVWLGVTVAVLAAVGYFFYNQLNVDKTPKKVEKREKVVKEKKKKERAKPKEDGKKREKKKKTFTVGELKGEGLNNMENIDDSKQVLNFLKGKDFQLATSEKVKGAAAVANSLAHEKLGRRKAQKSKEEYTAPEASSDDEQDVGDFVEVKTQKKEKTAKKSEDKPEKKKFKKEFFKEDEEAKKAAREARKNRPAGESGEKRERRGPRADGEPRERRAPRERREGEENRAPRTRRTENKEEKEVDNSPKVPDTRSREEKKAERKERRAREREEAQRREENPTSDSAEDEKPKKEKRKPAPPPIFQSVYEAAHVDDILNNLTSFFAANPSPVKEKKQRAPRERKPKEKKTEGDNKNAEQVSEDNQEQQ
eukprot:TRINITY_DN684_c0_g1_i1.p1 TRINITY_DN684_c0_g1~~TRINITY_DN684_c0_g1_i1.p1  ORF type:complete len:372 (+),score=217.05 TRINITY_DN684_c0_g1_i1:207-1322(+)